MEERKDVKKVLLPYGIFYYGLMLESLKTKLQQATFSLAYIPPDVKEELSILSDLRDATKFEDIGEEANLWLERIAKQGLPYQSARELYETCIRWETKFIDNITKLLLITPKVEVLDLEKLKKGLNAFLSDKEIKWLSKLEKRCMSEMITSLIVGIPTAAEFLGVRVCESILRRWYKWKTGRDVERKGWGQVLDELSQEYGREYPEQLDLLKYIKETRNRLAHPEKVSSQQDAETMFNIILRFIREASKIFREKEAPKN